MAPVPSRRWIRNWPTNTTPARLEPSLGIDTAFPFPFEICRDNSGRACPQPVVSTEIGEVQELESPTSLRNLRRTAPASGRANASRAPAAHGGGPCLPRGAGAYR